MKANDIGPHPFIPARGGEWVCAVCEYTRIYFRHDAFRGWSPTKHGEA